MEKEKVSKPIDSRDVVNPPFNPNAESKGFDSFFPIREPVEATVFREAFGFSGRKCGLAREKKRGGKEKKRESEACGPALKREQEKTVDQPTLEYVRFLGIESS